MIPAKRKCSLSSVRFGILVLLLFPVCLLFLCSCKQTVYTRPDVPPPAVYRGSNGEFIPQNTPDKTGTTLAEIYWGDLIQDDVLKSLISSALIRNYDARLAAERIMAAEAQLGITRANQYPNISGTAGYQAGKVSTVGSTPVPPGSADTSHGYSAQLQMVNYELDFWGRLHRATDAARADLLSTQEAQNVVMTSLVSEVATAYFTLRELDWELEICKKTVASREESYKLVKAREEGGVTGMMDVEQAKGLLLNAQATLIATQQKIGQQENFLSYILGQNPGNIPRGKPLQYQLGNLNLPPGLPSTLLENRPDIRQMEAQLIAANARIDVARAAFFPQITLTGTEGTSSKDLNNLLTAPSNTWTVIPQLLQPIFNAGQISSNVKLTESQQRQLVIQYESTVRGAFREVSDSLVGYSKGREYRLKAEELTATLSEEVRLANLRYLGGVASYLEVLDSEKDYFSSELQLAQTKLNEVLYIIKLYKALGGGWKQK
ncbi:MAG: efflux transporter outer membrane subunit [Firmicutes bacterium]|nr:efflux transporter outer membrane subunit [Bacillota bacterium]